MKRAGLKAAYLMPIVLTLTARKAKADHGSGFHSQCGDEGSPCLEHVDCCTGLNCSTDMMSGCKAMG